MQAVLSRIFAHRYFIEVLVIALMQGAQPSVPKQKVQPVISFEVQMVHVVVYRGIDPTADTAF